MRVARAPPTIGSDHRWTGKIDKAPRSGVDMGRLDLDRERCRASTQTSPHHRLWQVV